MPAPPTYSAREKGVSATSATGPTAGPRYTGSISRLFRLAVEKAPAGSVPHGVGEEGVAIRAIAEVIGRHVNVPVTAAAEDAGAHFGFLGPLYQARHAGLEHADP